MKIWRRRSCNGSRKREARMCKSQAKFLKTKAIESSEILGVEVFQASEGWLKKFKQRNSIVFKGNQRETAEIDVEALGNWQQEVLRKSISFYSADDVFNADETGLFWLLLANNTLSFKNWRALYVGEEVQGENYSARRIKYVRIREVAFACYRKVSQAACVQEQEGATGLQGEQKGVDDCGSVQKISQELGSEAETRRAQSTTLSGQFRGPFEHQVGEHYDRLPPPNTTTASQPMEQGIIQNLKVHYCRFLLRECITAFDLKTDYKPDLFKALQFLRRSWDAVKPETLANCFRKAGYVKNAVAAEPTLEDQIDAEVRAMGEQPLDDELKIMWAELEAMQLTEGGLEEYLAVHDQLSTGGTRSLKEIAADVSTAEEIEVGSDTEVIEIEEAPEPLVTAREATAAIKVFQQFVEENSSDPTLIQLTDKLDDFLAK